MQVGILVHAYRTPGKGFQLLLHHVATLVFDHVMNRNHIAGSLIDFFVEKLVGIGKRFFAGRGTHQENRGDSCRGSGKHT